MVLPNLNCNPHVDGQDEDMDEHVIHDEQDAGVDEGMDAGGGATLYKQFKCIDGVWDEQIHNCSQVILCV
jgi:hypothetical protein